MQAITVPTPDTVSI